MHQRAARTQKALLIGVEDADEAHLRQVEAFTQQVDADDHVVHTEPQVAENLDALERVDLAVQVVRAHPHLLQIVREILGHALRQRRDEDALILRRALLHFVEQIVDLAARRPHVDLWIDQSRRADHLFDDLRTARHLQRPRRR